MNLDSLPIDQLQAAPQKLFQTITSVNLPGGLVFAPNYIEAGLIVLMIFLLVVTLGMLRHRYANWGLKGVLPGVTFGFLLALLLEGMLLVGGKTILTEVLGWKDAPKPISNALEASRTSFVSVLGAESAIPESAAKEPSVGSIMSSYTELPDSEKESLQSLICPAE
jgi:hypothetical protein